jgi:cobalt-zinc-cadmium efflux system outer membrane protein
VEQRQEAVRQSLWAAAQVFQRALAARELVGLAKLGSQLAHASHGAVSRRFQAGQVPGLDVRLADMERVAADQALGVAEADHRLVLAELSGITGLPPEEVRGVEGALVRNDPLPTREEAVVRAETRADVRALRAWALAAREDANVATAERFPTPQVRANYQYWHGEHSVLAGVELPLPIFARGQGQEARARARANGLLDEAEARQHRIRAEVAAVWDVANRLSAARRAYAQQDAGDIQQAVQDALRNYLERRMDMATLLGIQRLALQAARSALDLAAREAHARLWLDAAMGVLS